MTSRPSVRNSTFLTHVKMGTRLLLLMNETLLQTKFQLHHWKWNVQPKIPKLIAHMESWRDVLLPWMDFLLRLLLFLPDQKWAM